MSYLEIKVEKILNECDKHLLRVNSSYLHMSSFMPLTKQDYLKLTEQNITDIDQFLYRFGKLQDAVGEKLFPAILLFLREEKVRSKSFIDILNRLEKLEILDNKEDWFELRKIRNDLSHNYDDNPEEMASAINYIYEKKGILESIYLKVRHFYEEK
ncbi:MAG: hypothetical protein PF440_02235 [Thiomicrorhabdus sp.]|jgi:hypothetical protein|nr:hypothetical protein [Thiomicrorhabdus sp.]